MALRTPETRGSSSAPAPRRGRLVGPALLAIAALWMLSVGAAPASAAVEKYEGKVLSCKFVLSADSTQHSLSAAISSCGGSLEPEAEVEASWEAGEEAHQTTFELETAKLSVLGSEQSFDLGYTLSIPVDVDELIATYEEAKKLQAEGKKTVKEVQEAKAKVAEQLEKALKEFEERLIVTAAEALAGQLGNGVTPAVEHFNGLANSLNGECEADGTDLHNPFCLPYSPESPPCTIGCPVPAKANDGALSEATGEDAEESDSDQAALCPFLNSSQHDAVFVCVPSFVSGDLNTGAKPLVIIGGGALMMIPTPSGGAKIQSTDAVVGLGGAIVGDEVEIDAPDIALAGGFLNGVGAVTLAGESISIGLIDGETLLKGISSLPGDWHGEIVDAATLHTQIDVPELVSARHVVVKASEDLLLASGSKIDGSGLGGHGGDFASGIDPSGEQEDFGASHGGLGGFGFSSPASFSYDDWYSLEGRSPVRDDPFEPTEAGDGGGGEAGGALGLPGGGAVAIESPEADVTLEGKIDVSGFGTGLQNEFSNGDHGGSGAGGSVYLTAEKLAGKGTIDADGGSHCANDGGPGECSSGHGGSGGGGRIAALFEEDPGWSGKLEAFGGVDHGYHLGSENEFLGSGGAGTVFTRSVVFDAKGAVKEGKGAFSDGTLRIDGGSPVGEFPPPDGTPLQDSWGAPHRKLSITGDARAYGHELHYGAVELTAGGVLTTGISTAGAAIPKTLSITADSLTVDPTSRVTMTGRGFAGGAGATAEGAAESAPGQTASTEGHGGSHGGAGGAAGAHQPPGPKSGSTYDSAEAPAQPGGGGAGVEGESEGNAGGGVLDVTVGALQLEGTLSADGQSGDGPTATEPAGFDFVGGGGAGGSLLVHAGTISGAGALTALGGDSCISQTPPLVGETAGCGLPVGSAGGGGGGRVALIAAAACGWTGTLNAAGGVDQQADRAGEADDAAADRGSAGSVFFPAPAVACPAPVPAEPPAKGAEGGGPKTGEKPPPAPPSNRFTIVSRRTLARTGAELVTVALPGAGSLTGRETTMLKAGRRHVSKRLTVSRVRVSAARAGSTVLRFVLSKAARALLERHGRIAVTITISYTPAGGSAASRAVRVTIVRPRR
jgi:hypothetical protein